MALDNYHSYYVDDHFVLPPPPPPQLDWDWDQLQLHTLGGGGGDAAQDGIHGAFLPAMLGLESPESSSSEASSGYLQDAVAHWSDRCNKRQRMAEAAAPPRRPAAAAANEDLHCLLQSFWDSSSSGGEGGLMHDLNIMIPESGSFVSGDEDDASGWEQEQRGPISAAAAAATSAVQVPAAQGGGGGEAADPILHNHNSSPATSRTTTGQGAAQQLQLQKATSAAGAGHAAAAAGRPGRRGNYSCEEHVFVGKQQQQPSPSSRAASASSPRRSSSLTGKEKRDTGVLYPFAVVKPLGLEGGGAATLNDVNQRILKRPARPVRHPVGQFACSPAVYAHGLGLSGKAVVSLTRIRTAGKGTITIIRTRG
uniref:Protein XRI1 n=1 Tax=Oryza glumipatula TaxID=40148 RepID=A0A0D9YZ17_9ORYZ